MLVRPLNRTLVSALLTAVMAALVLPTTSAPDVDRHHSTRGSLNRLKERN